VPAASRDVNGAAMTIDGGTTHEHRPQRLEPSHFLWDFDGDVATITLNRRSRRTR
jgi:hypothetical protein